MTSTSSVHLSTQESSFRQVLERLASLDSLSPTKKDGFNTTNLARNVFANAGAKMDRLFELNFIQFCIKNKKWINAQDLNLIERVTHKFFGGQRTELRKLIDLLAKEIINNEEVPLRKYQELCSSHHSFLQLSLFDNIPSFQCFRDALGDPSSSKKDDDQEKDLFDNSAGGEATPDNEEQQFLFSQQEQILNDAIAEIQSETPIEKTTTKDVFLDPHENTSFFTTKNLTALAIGTISVTVLFFVSRGLFTDSTQPNSHYNESELPPLQNQEGFDIKGNDELLKPTFRHFPLIQDPTLGNATHSFAPFKFVKPVDQTQDFQLNEDTVPFKERNIVQIEPQTQEETANPEVVIVQEPSIINIPTPIESNEVAEDETPALNSSDAACETEKDVQEKTNEAQIDQLPVNPTAKTTSTQEIETKNSQETVSKSSIDQDSSKIHQVNFSYPSNQTKMIITAGVIGTLISACFVLGICCGSSNDSNPGDQGNDGDDDVKSNPFIESKKEKNRSSNSSSTSAEDKKPSKNKSSSSTSQSFSVSSKDSSSQTEKDDAPVHGVKRGPGAPHLNPKNDASQNHDPADTTPTDVTVISPAPATVAQFSDGKAASSPRPLKKTKAQKEEKWAKNEKKWVIQAEKKEKQKTPQKSPQNNPAAVKDLPQKNLEVNVVHADSSVEPKKVEVVFQSFDLTELENYKTLSEKENGSKFLERTVKIAEKINLAIAEPDAREKLFKEIRIELANISKEVLLSLRYHTHNKEECFIFLQVCNLVQGCINKSQILQIQFPTYPITLTQNDLVNTQMLILKWTLISTVLCDGRDSLNAESFLKNSLKEMSQSFKEGFNLALKRFFSKFEVGLLIKYSSTGLQSQHYLPQLRNLKDNYQSIEISENDFKHIDSPLSTQPTLETLPTQIESKVAEEKPAQLILQESGRIPENKFVNEIFSAPTNVKPKNQVPEELKSEALPAKPGAALPQGAVIPHAAMEDVDQKEFTGETQEKNIANQSLENKIKTNFAFAYHLEKGLDMLRKTPNGSSSPSLSSRDSQTETDSSDENSEPSSEESKPLAKKNSTGSFQTAEVAPSEVPKVNLSKSPVKPKTPTKVAGKNKGEVATKDSVPPEIIKHLTPSKKRPEVSVKSPNKDGKMVVLKVLDTANAIARKIYQGLPRESSKIVPNSTMTEDATKIICKEIETLSNAILLKLKAEKHTPENLNKGIASMFSASQSLQMCMDLLKGNETFKVKTYRSFSEAIKSKESFLALEIKWRINLIIATYDENKESAKKELSDLLNANIQKFESSDLLNFFCEAETKFLAELCKGNNILISILENKPISSNRRLEYDSSSESSQEEVQDQKLLQGPPLTLKQSNYDNSHIE